MTIASASAAWLDFLASPAAPGNALSPLALEGYLTGIVVAPELIPPSRWIAALWGDEEPVFDNDADLHAVLGTLMTRYNSLLAEIDSGLERLEAERVCDYRPAFLDAGEKPDRQAIRDWVSGFWRAMALAPEGWTAFAGDERLQPVITPFIGFIDLDDGAFVPADDIDERLDDAAGQIPRAILVLHKIAKIRAARGPRKAEPVRQAKVGRNDTCPCGSGKKYKRCCGAN
ncbi:uncharacterized protein FBZ89_1574 [Nitrospirillum amazonense]|uniref:YecA family protein n=1 Tax=Nitrospirillum amazonense TaxID=28077 RepID=A0A560EGR0_9PROT|nr:YecA family protein [Nitrospirillum amazonense]TWB08502.1 uncharacterized protein FBZ89_1574 [Nitrospirillum amazonense]